jgi:hypothetical protein
MWEQRMWRYHGDNKKVYEYITVKLRENSLMEYLAPKTELLPSVYRYPPPHAASSGEKSSSTTSAKSSRTRPTWRTAAVESWRVSSRPTSSYTRCSLRTIFNTQWTSPSTKSMSIGAATPSMPSHALPSTGRL